jgi:hypothetical protein
MATWRESDVDSRWETTRCRWGRRRRGHGHIQSIINVHNSTRSRSRRRSGIGLMEPRRTPRGTTREMNWSRSIIKLHSRCRDKWRGQHHWVHWILRPSLRLRLRLVLVLVLSRWRLGSGGGSRLERRAGCCHEHGGDHMDLVHRPIARVQITVRI